MKKDSSIKKFLKKILQELEDLKALDIVVIDIKKRSALADYLIIVSGNSSRHINAITSKLIKNNKKKDNIYRGLEVNGLVYCGLWRCYT